MSANGQEDKVFEDPMTYAVARVFSIILSRVALDLSQDGVDGDRINKYIKRIMDRLYDCENTFGDRLTEHGVSAYSDDPITILDKETRHNAQADRFTLHIAVLLYGFLKSGNHDDEIRLGIRDPDDF